MSLINSLPRPEIVDGKGRLWTPWLTWFSTLQTIIQTIGANGTTAARPTSGLYVGYQYIDSTLGKPIWVKSLNPTVWIDATGTSV